VETGSRFRNVAGAVLVGGASSRMGADKAALELGGVALATRCADTLAALVEDVVLVGGAPPDAAPGRRVPDPPGPRCALRGLVGALAACDAPRVLVLATDLPFVTRDLLLALIAWPEADVVAPRGARGPEPLCALYHRAPALALARHALEAERLALHALLDALDTRYLEGADLAAVDPERRALTNLNSPDDLALAERTLSAPAGRG
jgi:molybdopterin-guanine dinucleotide biosynthesis protein A